MQPPPRKVKVTQELKNIQGEQMTKLQAKHQAECDLLEDMRTFSQKKAAIEREYAQGIQKLASQYLKRDWPGIKSDDRNDYRSMYPVWKSFLEGTMQVAQSRINICENYKNFISEPARTVRSLKEQQLKRCVDQLTKIQTELQETVKDLAKGKKKYFETEQMAHAVREKADIEAKSKLSLFQSRVSLQKASVKLKARRSECNSKATHARNDYLLTLAAANAHQDRYYQTDLVNIMKFRERDQLCPETTSSFLESRGKAFSGILTEKQMLEEVTGLRNTILQFFFLFVYCSEFPFHPNYSVMITGDQNASYSNEIRELEGNSASTPLPTPPKVLEPDLQLF